MTVSSHKQLRRARASGFSLIELMVAITVVGIITAIAVTSYGSSMTKTRRAAAKACLTEGAQYMERYYTLHFSYNDATDPPALPGCTTDVTDFYTIAFVAGSLKATEFTIQATPQGNQATSDSRCGTLTLNHAGVQGATDVEACW